MPPRVLPDSVGYHLAGLADGEACFSISIGPRSGCCAFIIKMRADDAPLLLSLRDELGGIGKVYMQGSTTTESRVRRPQVRWSVHRKKEVRFLTELFDVYPLRSKKARDYAIWREAVIAWNNGMSPKDLEPYKRDLQEARKWREPDD